MHQLAEMFMWRKRLQSFAKDVAKISILFLDNSLKQLVMLAAIRWQIFLQTESESHSLKGTKENTILSTKE